MVMKLPDFIGNTFEPLLLGEIETRATIREVKEGELILDIGQVVTIIPVMLEGIVKVSREDDEGKELLLYYLNVEQSCAMTFTCCMQQYPSEIKAIAETDASFIAIPISFMDEWLMKYPTWKSFVMRTIRSRFNELLQTIDQLAFQRLDERLAHYLKEKSSVTGSSLISLSHEEIAIELASSRVVISRLLKRLENEGKLLLYRNQVKLLRDL